MHSMATLFGMRERGAYASLFYAQNGKGRFMRTYLLKLKNVLKVQIIIRTLKRGFIILFASMLLVLSPITCYLDASRVQATAVAGVSLLQILEGLLASFGITYLSSELFGDGTDGSSALDDLYNEWWDSYMKEREKLISGGSGSEPDTEPDSGKPVIIPTFEELIDSCKDGVIDISKDVWGCLKGLANKIVDNVHGIGLFPLPEGEIFKKPVYDESKYPYFIFCPMINDGSRIFMYYYFDSLWSYYSASGVEIVSHRGKTVYYLKNGKTETYEYDYESGYFTCLTKTYFNLNGLITNAKIYDNKEDALGHENDNNFADSPYRKETIWIHPDFNYQGDSKPELNPPTNPYSVPDMQTLQALQQGLKDNQNNIEQQNELLKGYFGNLGLDPNPDTDPETKPSEKPEESEKPTEKPEETEKPGVPEGAGGFTADFKKLFPFCIPFDLVRAFKVFNADPVAPKFEWTLKIKFIDFEYKFVLDLKEFNSVAVVCRSLILILFILGLILVTRNLIRG